MGARKKRLRGYVHLHAGGRYTWCRRAWHKRRKGRWITCLQWVNVESAVTCPDCLAELAATRLLRSNI